MRYREFKLTEQQLDELKMSPKSLGAFAKSPLAKGIQAGFEAEVIFPDLGGDDEDGDMEPDYDYDESANGIDDIIRFFEYDNYGYGMSDRESRNLYNQLLEAYQEYADDKTMSEFRTEAENLIKEYIEENEWDWDERIREHLTSELKLSDEEAQAVMDAGQKATSTKDVPEQYAEARDAVDDELRSRAELSLSDEDDIYERVLDQFREDFEPPEEREWLEDQGLDYMSDVAREYDLTWPYMRVEDGDRDGFNEYNANELADDLSKELGVKTKVSSGYHSATRDNETWIFEPDSSLEGSSGDMPVEIVSPPMPLDQCLTALDDFFSWAKGHNAYTNSSTGFHMGVSLPEVGGKVDFVKLALFLGDEYVLQSFGRQAVGFCESAIKKIKNRMKGQDTRIADAMALMRKGLIDIAHNSIASDEGFGKYTSINPKGNYIEFRSAGGEDYFADIPRLRNMLLRYAQAMVVAADPKAERQEYYKKLYKLIAPATGDASLDLFARFASGAISKEELKQQWAEATLAKDAPELSKTGNWKVYDTEQEKYLPGYQYGGYTESEALALFKQAYRPGGSMEDFKKYMQHMGWELRNVSASTGKWAIINKDTGETLEVVGSETRGPVADMAADVYGDKGINYYIEPVPSDTPKPKLSRRVELAKRIKGPTPPNYYIRNMETEEVVYLYSARDNEEAVKLLNKYSSTHPGKFQYGQTRFLKPDELAQAKKNTEANTTMQQPAQQAEPRHAQQVMSPNGVPMWEIYNRVTGLGLHQFADHTQNLAWQTAQTWAQEQGFADRMDVLSVRPLMPQV